MRQLSAVLGGSMIIKILAWCAIAAGIFYLFNIDNWTAKGIWEAIALIFIGLLGVSGDWSNHKS
jgi:hypothetical protein